MKIGIKWYVVQKRYTELNYKAPWQDHNFGHTNKREAISVRARAVKSNPNYEFRILVLELKEIL